VPGGQIVHDHHAVPRPPEDADHVRPDVARTARDAEVHLSASLAHFKRRSRTACAGSRLWRITRLPSGPARGIQGSMRTNPSLGALACAIAFPLLAACGHDNPPPNTSAGAATGTPPTLSSVTPARKSDQDVTVSQNIRDVCKIDDSERSPKFDYDSSQLSSSDRDILQQVAKCMTEGALKGKNVELVGRADPRGEQEYNMTLGSSRATAAHKYLGGLGVDDKRMSETSRGALDATGHDEEGWAKDRRVDIRVAGP
jgi:peptidoglycan-associated lipoprotein